MQHTKRITSILLFSCSIALAFLPDISSATCSPHIFTQEHPDSSADLISVLDDCVQQRFLDVDQGFGFRRIVRLGETPHRFKPENAKELSIVGYLMKVKLNVVLYLAGRNILNTGSDTTEVNGNAGRFIKGPVLITDNDKRVIGPPTALELLEHGQKAMRDVQKSDRYDFAIREWKIIARPVRASDSSCLKCHRYNEIDVLPEAKLEQESRRLKIGDPLGVLLYAYKNGQ
jgi:hypothetical protein